VHVLQSSDTSQLVLMVSIVLLIIHYCIASRMFEFCDVKCL